MMRIAVNRHGIMTAIGKNRDKASGDRARASWPEIFCAAISIEMRFPRTRSDNHRNKPNKALFGYPPGQVELDPGKFDRVLFLPGAGVGEMYKRRLV
jgi:hypothetical protein